MTKTECLYAKAEVLSRYCQSWDEILGSKKSGQQGSDKVLERLFKRPAMERQGREGASFSGRSYSAD